ncbi:hypothetical protein OXPF_11690 [Oxobacter pfennigii]|uniref:Uncharacterized protein n=1 Tax=Oxobacter pfennigii TaxID=36849 RepID=A0A0P8YZI3_9CLOT|nr:DUF4097 family beta strand repeat-containing protein [Oxobacter pfennigii]KPU45276.1 hypothetical protein OXPF_11690 [Oxobacter pfennigii]
MKKRIIAAMLMIYVSIMLSACDLINIGGRTIGLNRVEENTQKTIEAGGIKTIEVISPVGSVDIETWEKNEIQIVATKINNGLKEKAELLDELKNAEIFYEKKDDKYTIKAFLPKFKNNGMSVEFEIYVPQTIKAYKVDAEVGDIKLSGAEGDIDVVNNVGKIDLNDCWGVINLKAVTGDVTVRKSSLKADSALTSNVGRVLFDGTIGTEGTYKFTTNVGMVDVSLPSDTAFEIDAKTNVGNIDCDFDISGTEENMEVKGKVKGGGAKVIIVNNTGSVNISKR